LTKKTRFGASATARGALTCAIPTGTTTGTLVGTTTTTAGNYKITNVVCPGHSVSFLEI
jgi:hypothetical protein